MLNGCLFHWRNPNRDSSHILSLAQLSSSVLLTRHSEYFKHKWPDFWKSNKKKHLSAGSLVLKWHLSKGWRFSSSWFVIGQTEEQQVYFYTFIHCLWWTSFGFLLFFIRAGLKIAVWKRYDKPNWKQLVPFPQLTFSPGERFCCLRTERHLNANSLLRNIDCETLYTGGCCFFFCAYFAVPLDFWDSVAPHYRVLLNRWP